MRGVAFTLPSGTHVTIERVQLELHPMRLVAVVQSWVLALLGREPVDARPSSVGGQTQAALSQPTVTLAVRRPRVLVVKRRADKAAAGAGGLHTPEANSGRNTPLVGASPSHSPAGSDADDKAASDDDEAPHAETQTQSVTAALLAAVRAAGVWLFLRVVPSGEVRVDDASASLALVAGAGAVVDVKLDWALLRTETRFTPALALAIRLASSACELTLSEGDMRSQRGAPRPMASVLPAEASVSFAGLPSAKNAIPRAVNIDCEGVAARFGEEHLQIVVQAVLRAVESDPDFARALGRSLAGEAVPGPYHTLTCLASCF